MKLMMRHYDPQQGKILLDGKDLREYDPRAVRACISIVAQENEAFSTTLRENILYGMSETDKKIVSDADIKVHLNQKYNLILITV